MGGLRVNFRFFSKSSEPGSEYQMMWIQTGGFVSWFDIGWNANKQEIGEIV